VLTIPGQVNGPKLANNAITTDTLCRKTSA